MFKKLVVAASLAIGLFSMGTVPALFAEEIYQENFASLGNNWGDYKEQHVKDGKLVYDLEATNSQWLMTCNYSRYFSDFDASLDACVVKSTDPKDAQAGLAFWADDKRFYIFKYGTWGEVKLVCRENKQWVPVVNWRLCPAVKTKPGEINHLRVVAKGNKVTCYLNGMQVIAPVTIEPPQGGGNIGAAGECGEKGTATLEFTNLVVKS